MVLAADLKARLARRYHSHPTFAPQPSSKDNDNQRNYQAQFHVEATRMEPFVGAIVGPYDQALPSTVGFIQSWPSPGPCEP